jgi:type VI protein secretion system component Hcp
VIAMGNLVQKGFLKLDGPKFQGDSDVNKFEGQIAVLDMSFGVTQSGKYEASPKTIITNATDCSIRKYMGASSPELAQACAKKTPIDKATITFPGRLTLILSKVIVTSVNPSMNVEEDLPTEVITLGFRKAEWTYEAEKGKGTGEFDLDKLQ